MITEPNDQSPAVSEPWRVLNLGGVSIDDRKAVNLRDLGFEYRVSDEAREEIRQNERRARRVLETAHLFWFGGRHAR